MKTKPISNVRELSPSLKTGVFFFFERIGEMRDLVDMSRPVTIHWADLEAEFSVIAQELLKDALSTEEIASVITLLAMWGAGATVDLEDGSYE